MRRVPSFALLLVSLLMLGACAGTMRWEKPGADQAMAQNDSAECRQAAQREAFRYYSPPFPYWYGWPYGRGPSYMAYRMSWESDRFSTENRLQAFCMRSRGYELVRVEQAKAKE
jgi:hypothetical protein